MQSKLVLGIILLGTIFGVLNYVTTERVYKITSLLQAYSPQNSLSTDILSIYDDKGSEISDYESLYKARTNLIKVIKANNLNLKFEGTDTKLADNLIKDFVPNNLGTSFYLIFDKDKYKFLNSDMDVLLETTYGLTENEFIKLNIAKPADIIPDTVKIIYTPVDKYFSPFKGKISVDSFTSSRYTSKKSGLLQVSLLSTDVEKGKRVLDYANDQFILNNVKSESEEATKALDFINANLSEIEKQLNSDKDNLKNFQERNKSVNVDLEIRSIIDNVYAIESNINKIDVELAKASNTLTETNPIYIELLQQKEELLKQQAFIEERIKGLPLAQQEYIDLFNKLQTTQEVYSMLLNKQIEFSIREASTLGNIRVIDNAYLENKVSPTLTTAIIYALISVLIAVAVAIVRGFYFLPITNPAEIADRGIDIDIAGVIPKAEKGDENEERFLQSIQSLIVNINNKVELSDKIDGAVKILITSPTPSNGKSYISRNLASKLSELGKRVLLLDGDWKRGDLHKDLNTEKISLKEFNQINTDNISKYEIQKNFFFVPKISGVSNSFQYLYSSTFAEKMEELNNAFDYIVIDTAPLLSVSDTAILMSNADLRFCVARHDLSKINELKQLFTICSQLGTFMNGIIYNSYERPSSYYGYYGLYGNYAYQYYAKKYLYDSYGYGKDDE